VHIRASVPRFRVGCNEVNQPLSTFGSVKGLGLGLQFSWPCTECENLALLMEGDARR
jgi:hypothetical protein